MSRKRSEAEFPELEGVMFITPAERAKAEARIRAQREAAATAQAEAARIEEVRACVPSPRCPVFERRASIF